MRRARLMIGGAVQGVGFRPFAYRLAQDLGLTGWIHNTAHGVTIEVEGPRAGLESFNLMVDARNERAVQRLRERKRREEKPFALMFPSRAAVKARCAVSRLEERLLCSPEAPIVLLRRLPAPALGSRGRMACRSAAFSPFRHALAEERGRSEGRAPARRHA